MSDAVGAVTKIIEETKDETFVSPTWVAMRAILILDPQKISPAAVRWLAIEHLKHVARKLLAKLFDSTQPDSPQHEIFTGLQSRYPVAGSGSNKNPQYVKRDEMSYGDVVFNVDRFRKASESLAKHADALLAWWDGRKH